MLQQFREQDKNPRKQFENIQEGHLTTAVNSTPPTPVSAKMAESGVPLSFSFSSPRAVLVREEANSLDCS